MSPGVACDGSAMEFKEMQNQNRLPNHVVYVIEPNISSNDFLSMINQAVHNTNMDSDDSLRTKYGAPGNSSSTLENCLSGSPTSNSIKTVQCFLHSDKHCRKKLSDASCLSKINTTVTQNENSRNVPTEKFLNIGHATHWNYVKGTKECMKHSNLLQDSCRTLASQPNIDTLVMCGLHACGDLSATMLRIFAACSQAVALTLVGCCYMKLTCLQTKETASSCGYPLSHYICGFSHCLSYEALEMACHFVDAYCQRLKDEMPSLRRHCYRAAVQIILIRLDPNFKNDCIRLTVKKAEELSFSTYAELCLKRFGMAETIPTAILEEAEANLCRWKDVVSFYTVRLCLAPVVETLILLDRLLHLHEKGISCALLPIFDPKLSPRNFLLLAVKKRVVD